MIRRRNRKKLNSSEEGSHDKPQGIPPLENRDTQPASETSRKPKEIGFQPLPSNKIEKSSSLDDDMDLGDDFNENELSSSDSQIALPSSDGKTGMRTLRRKNNTNEPDASEELGEPEAAQPEKKQRIAKTPSKKNTYQVETNSLKDDDFESIAQQGEKLAKVDMGIAIANPAEPSTKVEKEKEKESASTATPTRSLREIAKNALNSLSFVEKASIALLTIILVITAIWSTAVVSARIPKTIIASKLKYPLKGESIALASFESYWRAPIRQGDNADEGVSETIEIIPEVKISLDSSSEAKSLRFLFRDEEGRFVGDSSTVKISGSKFLPSDKVTSHTKGSTATIRSTTGFEHEGELISYLADETFQWEVVILESKDGIEFTEFIAIPISANRKDNS